MRPSVNDANKYLRQTVKSVEAGGVATLARAMEHPGILQEIHVTTLDASDAEIPAAAGLSEGVKLPTRIETKKLVIVGKFPIATQAEYDALSDAMKDKAVLLNVTECPIGSEVKAIECNALGVPVDAHMWIMGADGWKGGSSSTLNPDGSTSFGGPVTEPFSYPRLPRRGRGSLPPNGIPVALQANRSFIVRKPAPKGKTILRARVWVRHYGTVGTGFSNPAIITGIKVSGAAQQAGAAGLGGTWKTVPFVGGAPTLEIPLGKDQDPGIAILPSEVCTDWVSLSPVARTDAPETYGDAPLFDWIFRTGAVAPAGPNITAAVAPGVSQFTGGWLNSATDWIATPPSSTPDQTYDASYIWIEYEVAEQTKSVGIFGDSLMDGENSSGGTGEAGYIQRAMTAMGINYSTWAQGGRVSSATQEEFLRWAFNYTFDAVFLTPVSINDVIRGVNIDTAWSDYLSLRQAAMARGVRVIAVSPMPGPATSTTMPGDIRQRLIAAGHEFFDAGIFVAADSTLAAWAAGYSGDGYHPNNTSTPILKAALEAWMANRL